MRFITSLLLCSTSFAALPPPPAFLLPDDVVPRKHIIDVTIDPSKDNFDGRARIAVEQLTATSVIWLNAKDVIPKEASIEVGGRTLPARAQAVAGEFLGLELDTPAGPGRATLSIHYQGRLDEKSVVGPYRKKVADDWYVFTT